MRAVSAYELQKFLLFVHQELTVSPDLASFAGFRADKMDLIILSEITFLPGFLPR
jgi:hypothetical protein